MAMPSLISSALRRQPRMPQGWRDDIGSEEEVLWQAFTPEDVRQLIQQTSLDMYGAGFDFNSGSGFIQADVALFQ